MQKSILKLEVSNNASKYRTTIKTHHGRTLFLSLAVNGPIYTITDCFYTDRNQGRVGAVRYSSRPKKLRTLQFPAENLLAVIEAELDKKFYGVEFVETGQTNLSLDEYIDFKASSSNRKYRFLIMVGDGGNYHGLPMRLRTRLKTKLHRSVYVELAYYKDGKGVVKQCYYYDRQYQRQGIKIAPPTLISCFFPYTREGVLILLNHEICCDFTHIIVTDGIDVDANTTPLCGAV